MIKKELLKLFEQFPEEVQRTIARVIEFEQSRISLDRVHRFREEIRQIIEEEARDEA